MATGIRITCPSCQLQMAVPEELRGKKVRCKGCSAAVPVPAGPVPKKPAPAPAAKETAPISEEDDAKKPYGVTHTSLAPRCPHCAYELDPPEAKVCLHCGYHMVKRRREASIKAAEHTGGDWFKWLAPGVGALLGFFAVIGLFIYYHWFMPVAMMSQKDSDIFMKDRLGYFEKDNTEGIAYLFHPGIEVWFVVILLWLMWKLIRFAVKRLILNYTPPEKVISK